MKKDLNKEFKKCMEETKALCLASVMESSVSGMDADTIATNVKALRLVNRLMDLCGDLFEKQNALMDKMDLALDKYLEGAKN